MFIFIVPKKNSGYRPVINLKKLNKHIPYLPFKIEEQFPLKVIVPHIFKFDQKGA